MEILEIKTTVLKAAEGKVLRRKSDGHVFGNEMQLRKQEPFMAVTVS